MGAQPHRLFVAVRPPEDVLDAVERAAAPARRSMVGLRWTTREQWHVTLQFLGWQRELETIVAALPEVGRLAPFAVRLGGAGAFPSPRRARVVWLGGTEGTGALGRLAGAVADALGSTGFVPEKRPFHAHLTLARLRVPADVTPCVQALGDAPVGTAWTVREIVLYESRLRPGGAEHVPVSVVALEG